MLGSWVWPACVFDFFFFFFWSCDTEQCHRSVVFTGAEQSNKAEVSPLAIAIKMHIQITSCINTKTVNEDLCCVCSSAADLTLRDMHVHMLTDTQSLCSHYALVRITQSSALLFFLTCSATAAA